MDVPMSRMGERRNNSFHIDKGINVAGAVALLLLLFAMYSGFQALRDDYKKQSREVDIMWKDFSQRNPSLALSNP